MNEIVIQGLSKHNLKHISLTIPKEKIIVFTGVSGSGKSSIVFDTIAAESQRQMNVTYPPFVRSRLPKYKKPDVERIENLTASRDHDRSDWSCRIRKKYAYHTGICQTIGRQDDYY